MLLTSQYLDEVDALAGRIVVIDRGSVIASGTAAELKEQVGGELIFSSLAARAYARST